MSIRQDYSNADAAAMAKGFSTKETRTDYKYKEPVATTPSGLDTLQMMADKPNNDYTQKELTALSLMALEELMPMGPKKQEPEKQKPTEEEEKLSAIQRIVREATALAASNNNEELQSWEADNQHLAEVPQQQPQQNTNGNNNNQKSKKKVKGKTRYDCGSAKNTNKPTDLGHPDTIITGCPIDSAIPDVPATITGCLLLGALERLASYALVRCKHFPKYHHHHTSLWFDQLVLKAATAGSNLVYFEDKEPYFKELRSLFCTMRFCVRTAYQITCIPFSVAKKWIYYIDICASICSQYESQLAIERMKMNRALALQQQEQQ